MSIALIKLHKTLLPITLVKAGRIPFYANHWGGELPQNEHADGFAMLQSLPTVDKVTYRSSGLSVLSPGAIPTSLVHSTGTTGQPLLRYRGMDERESYQRLVDGQRKHWRGGKPRIVFNCLAGHVHGGRSGLNLADVELSVTTDYEQGLNRFIDLLTHEDILPGIHNPERVISAAPDNLAILTAALIERFGSTAPARIDRLINLTDVLPKNQSDFYRKVWAPTQLINRFSLSEIAGGATEMSDGMMRFDSSIVPEILSINTDESVISGIGELTLTELHPFSQMQPFIRYRTGDLVSVDGISAEGRPKLRLMGRISVTPTLNRNHQTIPLLSMINLRSRLDSEPQLQRDPLPEHVKSAAGLGSVLGSWSLAEKPYPILSILLAPTFNPLMFPLEAQHLADRVADHVKAEMNLAGQKNVCDVSVIWKPSVDLPMLGSRPGVWLDQADRA